jgi:hypothetical protein
MRVPTDYEIVNEIYDRYYKTFTTFTKDSPDRSAKILVPIDIVAIAKRLHVDVDIIFGRLYYHLEEKYGYVRPDGTHVVFFTLAAGSDKHCVNFPLLGAVLAGMRQERRRNLWAICVAVASFVVSAISVTISLLHKAPAGH